MLQSSRGGLSGFDGPLDGRFRGRRVRVESINGQRFEGYLDRVHMPERHVLLRDVQELPAGTEYVGAVVAHVDWIVPATGTLEIAELGPACVQPCAYAIAEFDPEANSQAIQAAAHRGFAGRFPVVTRQADQYVLVEGHRPLWVAEQAGLDTHPVIIEPLTEDELATRFAFDHFPLPHDLDFDGEGADNGDGDDSREPDHYSDAALRASIERYVADFGARALDIYPVRFNAERLGLHEELGLPNT